MTRWLLLAAALPIACARTPAPAVAVGQVTSGPAPHGFYAPTGERARLRLDASLDSGTTSAGKRFLAHLVDPLRDPDGRVVARAGASVLGHVDAITFSVTGAHMRLALDRIETVQGVATLAATIVAAEHESVPGELRKGPGGAIVQVPARVVMPAGAWITIELVRPIVIGAR